MRVSGAVGLENRRAPFSHPTRLHARPLLRDWAFLTLGKGEEFFETHGWFGSRLAWALRHLL